MQSMAAQAAMSAEMQDGWMPPTAGEGGEGGMGGGSASEQHAARPAMGTGDLGEAWDGADGDLRREDAGGEARRYSPYYQNATRQYLQRIAEERTRREVR